MNATITSHCRIDFVAWIQRIMTLTLAIHLGPLHLAVGQDPRNTLSFSVSTVELPSGINAQDAYPIDFNSDGNLDVVVTQLRYPGSPIRLVALRNVGRGQFVDASDEVLGDAKTVYARDLRVADFNGDGRQDLIIGDTGIDPANPYPGGPNRIFIQSPSGQLRDETSARLPIRDAFTHHISVGDIDGDGDIDIYSCSQFRLEVKDNTEPALYLNDGKGIFTLNRDRLPAPLASMFHQYASSLMVDIDKDGDLDLVLGGNWITEERDRILVNDGRGTFSYAPVEALPLRYGGRTWQTVAIASADFDGDGWPDLIMSRTPLSYDGVYLQLLLNNGNGTFRDASSEIQPQSWPEPTLTSPYIDKEFKTLESAKFG